MTKITKHVGRLKNSDTRCVVVFPQLPKDPNFSLIVDTDSLPDAVADNMSRIISSDAAYHEVELGNLLSRRPSMEPGVDMLSYLFKTNRLRRVPVSNVVMYPFPNQPHPLEEIIKLSGGKIESKKAPDNTGNPEKYNPYLDRQRAEQAQSKLDIATSKLREAELLDQEARKKREEAYSYFPQLRPGYNPNEDIMDKMIDERISKDIPNADDSVFSLEELGIKPDELGEIEIIPLAEEIAEETIKPSRGRRKKEV